MLARGQKRKQRREFEEENKQKAKLGNNFPNERKTMKKKDCQMINAGGKVKNFLNYF